MLRHARNRPDLVSGMKNVIEHQTCSDESVLYRLVAAGLVKEQSNNTCVVRCWLYEDYLGKHYMSERTNISKKFFVVGGTLGGDVSSYVRRPLDEDLLRFTLAGEYCNVLAARQMGKSTWIGAYCRKIDGT